MKRKLTLIIILLVVIVPLACADPADDPNLSLFKYDPGQTLLDTYLMLTDDLGPGTISLSGTAPYEYEIENWTGEGIYNLLVVVNFSNPVLLYSCGDVEPAFWSCATTPSSPVLTSTISWFFQNGDSSLFDIPDLGTPFYFELDGLVGVSDFNGATATVYANTPEPSTLLMLGTGLLCLGGSLKRKFFS